MVRTHRYFLPLDVRRCFAASLIASTWAAAPARADNLNFDEVDAGTALNLEYKDQELIVKAGLERRVVIRVGKADLSGNIGLYQRVNGNRKPIRFRNLVVKKADDK